MADGIALVGGHEAREATAAPAARSGGGDSLSLSLSSLPARCCQLGRSPLLVGGGGGGGGGSGSSSRANSDGGDGATAVAVSAAFALAAAPSVCICG